MKSGEKKETPQERLKRIMSKQLTKQSKYLFGLSALTFDYQPTSHSKRAFISSSQECL
jgi:hypothetical protein